MPTNTESLNRELFRLLSKYKPKPLDAEGKSTPIPDEADIFKFEFTKDGEDYGTVYVTLDEDRVLTVYFGDDVADSPDEKTPKLDYDDTWSGLLHQLSAWRMTKGLKGFDTQNKDRVGDDMARRNHMRNKDKIAEGAKWRQGYSASGHPAGYKHKSGEVGPIGGTFTDEPSGYDGDYKKIPVQKHRDKEDELAGRAATKLSTGGKPLLTKNAQKNLKTAITKSKGKHGPVGNLPENVAEGYYATGKKSSYSDAVPSVKIVIEHSRVIEEGEQRYRNINRIFLENQLGERYLLDTKKPGIARVYARHIAEGGKVNDDRWSHIGSLCEEYQKMAGFVRATRNGQFNESAQSLVNEGIAHYASLRESLSRMTGKRGYNAYFESWTPSLMEDGTEENNLNELFVQETLDPRIESVMPILSRIHKKVAESAVDKELGKLSEWADNLTEEESLTSNNPQGIPESDLSEGMDTEQRQRLDDLIDQYRSATDPSNDGYGVDDHYDPDQVIELIRQEFGDKVAQQVETGSEKMHFPRAGHSTQNDPMNWKEPVSRTTKAGKMYKQDSDYRKNTLKSRLRNSGKVTEEEVEEGTYGRRGDAYERDVQNAEYGMDRSGRRNKAGFEMDKEDWYIFKDGKMYKASIFPTQRSVAKAEGFSPTREEAKSKAGSQGVAEGRMVKGPGGVPLDRHGNPKVAKPKISKTSWMDEPEDDYDSEPEVNLDKIWFDVTQIISNIFPYGDPADYLPKYCRQHGCTYDDIRAAARKNGYEDEYAYIDDMKKGDYGYQQDVAEGKDPTSDSAQDARGDHRGDVKKNKDGSYVATNQSGSRKIFKSEKAADAHSKSGKEDMAEDIGPEQKRVGQLGPTEKVKNNNIGKLVGANENFINTVDQAVVSEEDEMAESILSAIKKVGKKVLDKVAPGDEELLKQLDKDVHGGKVPNRYNSDAESAKKYPADSRKVKVDESSDELARILTIMNHRR